MRGTVFIVLLLGLGVELAGCGGSQRVGASATASSTPVWAVPESGDVDRLRAALARAIAERDAARSQLRAALALQRQLQSRLDAAKVATGEPKPRWTAAGTQPQVFTDLSTTQNP